MNEWNLMPYIRHFQDKNFQEDLNTLKKVGIRTVLLMKLKQKHHYAKIIETKIEN